MGVTFGTVHSRRDLGLILTKSEIGLPEVKTYVIELPGGDGVLDVTEAVAGRVCYGNRTLRFTFQTAEAISGQGRSETMDAVTAAIHGKKLDIIMDEDPEHFFTGRCRVDSIGRGKGVDTIVVVCDCGPYRSTTDGETCI